MATLQQIYWSNGTEAQPVALKFKNESLFFQCCQTRYQYETTGASALQWQELAEQFQNAKGKRTSYMAEYCRVKAGKVMQ